MIKKLIFDVDGTLIKNVNFEKQASETLKKLGIYSTRNKEKFIEAMLTYENYYKKYTKENYTKHIGNSLKTDLDASFLKIYFEELKTAVPPFSLELLNNLTNLKKYYDLVILTNYFLESQMNRLKAMKIDHLFSECYGETIIKPYKESFMQAIRPFKPEECVMIGDNLNIDIFPAQNLGLHTILVNTKCYDTSTLDTVFVNNVEEINLDLINSLDEKNTRKLIRK